MYANYAKRRGFLTDQKKENVETENVLEKGKNKTKINSPRGGGCIGLGWCGLLCCGCGSGLGCCAVGVGVGWGWVVVLWEWVGCCVGGGKGAGQQLVSLISLWFTVCSWQVVMLAHCAEEQHGWTRIIISWLRIFMVQEGGRGRGDLLFRISLQLTICLFTMLVCHQTGADRETAGGRQVDRQTER